MSKRDEVYCRIIARLLTAQVKFGDRLLVKELGAELEVSRQPIMAALNRLEAEGFVRVIPQVGCQVLNPSRSEIADFYLMFERMEGLMAELAATRRTQSQLEELRDLHSSIMAIDFNDPDAARQYSVLNREFHQMLHVMARSRLLDERQHNNFNMSDFFINQLADFSKFMRDIAHEHEEIIDAIAMQAPIRARMITEAHIGGMGKAVLANMAA